MSSNTYSKVAIKDLMDENYTEDVKDKNGNPCVNGEVIAYKGENNQYQYEVCLKCGDYESSGSYCDGYNSEDNRYRVPTNALCKARNKVTYTGNRILLTIVNGTGGFSLSGQYQVDANEEGYEIMATLNSDEYYWSDDTQGPKYFYCKLYKKTPTITIEPYEGTVVVGAETDFIEKSEIPGMFTNIVEDTSIASIDHEERVNETKNKVFVKGLREKQTTNVDITFEPGESYKKNYNSVTKENSNIKYKINVIEGVDKPNISLCNDLEYNGEYQLLASAEEEGYTLKNNRAIDADKYVVTATLNKGYRWKDNSTNDISFECEIKKKVLPISWTTKENFTYNGKSQSNKPTVVSNVKNEEIILKWNKGINAGSYTSTAICDHIENGRK